MKSKRAARFSMRRSKPASLLPLRLRRHNGAAKHACCAKRDKRVVPPFYPTGGGEDVLPVWSVSYDSTAHASAGRGFGWTMKWAVYIGILVFVNVLSYVFEWGFWIY